ncbi:3-isopropylmalate dehydratase small subunit [Bacillus sp. DJP31]|uniref:3-isopropylmalate dehydratase small subunit n=1 Tax=Bacillus sp. DJP31 TaxID=3409789 RepID=UPI003BB7F872
MKPFLHLTGFVAPLPISNVDTDQIIPKQFLKRIERSGFGQFLFYDWRFNEDGSLIEDFPLNADRYQSASILLAGHNFGCGSSREHAPWALLDFGFQIIIAPSFADIFYNNCFKNGILPITLSEEQIDILFEHAENGSYELSIDLEEQTVSDNAGLLFTFQTDPYRRQALLEGLDDIALTEKHEAEISIYENNKAILYIK